MPTARSAIYLGKCFCWSLSARLRKPKRKDLLGKKTRVSGKPIGLPRLWTSRTANQASPNSMVIPVGINAWSAGSQDLRMMSSNHSEIYGHWACRRQRNVGSCFVGKKYGDFPMSRPTNMFVWICVLEGYASWTWPNYTMVFGPFAKWLMESQKAKIMSVIRCFFPSLVFIVTSKNLKKDGRTEHLPVPPDAKYGGAFNRRIRFVSCAKDFRASSKSLINSCLSSGLPHFWGWWGCWKGVEPCGEWRCTWNKGLNHKKWCAECVKVKTMLS